MSSHIPSESNQIPIADLLFAFDKKLRPPPPHPALKTMLIDSLSRARHDDNRKC